MHKIFLIFTTLCTVMVSMYFRFYNLDFSYLHPDSGYELEVGRIVNLSKKFPLIGPALSQYGIYIPPTYLHIISFLYFLGNGQMLIISLGFALFGFLTVVFLSLLIHLITSDRRITFLFFFMFSVWEYSVNMSRTIWHPHPLFLFLTMSLCFLVLALKKNKIVYLLLSQWLFFISLSVYPSPIFFLPIIIFGSFYFFNRNVNNLLKSLLCVGITLSSFFIIVYLPQIVFEIDNDFISLRTIFTDLGNNKLDTSSLMDHLYKSFQLFLSLFFMVKSKIVEFVFFIFFLFIIAASYFDRSKQPSFIKIFTTPFLLFWTLIIIVFLKNQSVYSVQRIDVLSIAFFILLAIGLFTIIKLKSSLAKISLCVIMSVYFFIFLLINSQNSLKLSARKNVDSPFLYEEIAKLIIKEISLTKISRSEVYIFNDDGYHQKDNSINNPENYLWYRKWMAERIDHFVNRFFYETNPLTDDYQHTLNYGKRLDYLDAKLYFLICRDNDADCLNRFLQSLRALENEQRYQFSEIKNISLNQNDIFPKIKIFLVAKQENW